MINSLKNFFIKSEENIETKISDLNILCGIMIEAANIDGTIDQKEIEKIFNFLVDLFEEKPENAISLLRSGYFQKQETTETKIIAAWTLVASTLLNMDEFVTRQ